MVKAKGVLENGVIRLREPVPFPSGTEVELTIEPRNKKPSAKTRRLAAERILSRKAVDIRPLSVRDLIEEGRDE